MTTSPIDKIHAALPGHQTKSDHLAQVKDQIEKIQEKGRRAQAEARGKWIHPGTRALRALLNAGDPLDNLVPTLATSLLEDQATEVAMSALVSTRDQLTSEIKAIADDGAAVFPLLGEALDAVLAKIRKLEPLDQIIDQETAFESRRFADAEQFAKHLETIVTLRREQVRILRAAGHGFESKLSIGLVIRNLEDVFDDALIWLNPGHLEHRTRNEQRPINPPWPEPLMSAASSTSFALWALQNGAQQWIPSPAQYAEYADALRAKAREPRADNRDDEWRDPASLGGSRRVLTPSSGRIR